MYKVRVERKAQKKLSKIPEPYYSNLKASILDLGNDPHPQGYKKLKGRDGYRIRVADYRRAKSKRIIQFDKEELGRRLNRGPKEKIGIVLESPEILGIQQIDSHEVYRHRFLTQGKAFRDAHLKTCQIGGATGALI